MNTKIKDLIAQINSLQEEIEKEYKHVREEFESRKVLLAENFLVQQNRHKIGILRFLSQSRILVILSTPVIYLGWLPFLLLDVFVFSYQAICFPIYGIPKVKRSDFVVFDRADLPFLNLIEKFNCLYCSYGNGVVSFASEVAARTEQYWCPIKHMRKVRGAHNYYHKFFDYGDAEAYRAGLARLRKQYSQKKENTGP
ncbi:MAG: hypothetical protein IPM97_08015 [Bdellovibrionaceae bacterium]|nr:hypothetical protein [Pseudobdellovibrionaceae bacterium]